MNESDTEANTKAIDSAAELRDGQIFQRRDARGRTLRPVGRALRARQRQTYTSLAVLNTGQAIIFTLGLAVDDG